MSVIETEDKKEIYTYKQILLCIRDEIIKNRILLKELSDLIVIEKNAGSHCFCNYLKNEEDVYKIKLTIEEIKKRQSFLELLFNKLTKYKFVKEKTSKIQSYFMIDDNGEYKFKLSYSDELEKNYFGSIKIVDKEKFNSIINELYSSKLAKITCKTLRLNNNLHVDISERLEIFDDKNSVSYFEENDSLNVDLYNKSLYKMLNTEIDSSLLSDEVIDLINCSSYKDYDIEIEKSKSEHNSYYEFDEIDNKIVLKKRISSIKTLIKID